MYIPYKLRVENRHSATPIVAAQVPDEYVGEIVTLISPTGRVATQEAGSKPEYGTAGVEFLTYEFAPEPSFYIIQFGELVYTFHHPLGATILVFEPQVYPRPTAPDQLYLPLPGYDAPPLEDIEIIDLAGNRRDLAWLDQKYGFKLVRTPVAEGVTHVCRLDKLVEREGPAIYMVNVKDADNMPVPDIPVLRYWPGAPVLPPYDPPTSRWYDQAVYGPTNGYGDWACGVGPGDAGTPGTGVTGIWTAFPNIPSDLADKWLWLINTEHMTMEVRFKIVPVEEEPEDDDEILDVLKEIRDLVSGGYLVLPQAIVSLVQSRDI